MKQTLPLAFAAIAEPWLVWLVVGTALVAATLSSALVALLIYAVSAAVLALWIRALQRRCADASNIPPNIDDQPTAMRRNDADRHVAGVEERLSHRLSLAHPVSGLPMREALLTRINADGRGLLGAIAFADFDRLTAFDPAMGERVFAQLAARLRRMTPESRFLSQVDRGHIGIWFGDVIDEKQAHAELDAMSYALGDAILDNGREIVPDVRLRLATYDAADGMPAAAFVSRTLASFALARGAQATEADRVDPTEFARDRYELEQDLRQAVTRRELSLEYQPLIDAERQCVCGAEALLRWDHPDRGRVSPVRFVPVMEAMGLASEIGSWVLNTAAREAAAWRSRGFPDLRMAVNVSGLQLERDDLPILIERTLQRHGLAASALEVELTESVATSDADHCRAIFEQLRTMGVKLAVDDFGTGYSGFSSLRTLRFDKIKIDREFVTAVDTRRDSQAICQSIIALARGLGIRVLAEGVERHAEYAWLRRHGCRHYQGYYFSRPLDPERFAAFVGDARGLARLLSLGNDSQTIIERLSA